MILGLLLHPAHYLHWLPRTAHQLSPFPPTHIDARLDGTLCPCALDGDFGLAPQQTFHLAGYFLRGLLGDLEDKVSPDFLGFRQPRGRQI